jgi:hypothetical protein
LHESRNATLIGEMAVIGNQDGVVNKNDRGLA